MVAFSRGKRLPSGSLYTRRTHTLRDWGQGVGEHLTLLARITKRQEPSGQSAATRTASRQLSVRSNPFALSRTQSGARFYLLR